MGVIRVTHREMRKILLEPRYLIILFAGIVFSFIFFATMTKEGQPTRLPVGVVDMDGTFLSRRICHEINATQGVSVHAVYDNHSEARKAMQRGEIYAFYEILGIYAGGDAELQAARHYGYARRWRCTARGTAKKRVWRGSNHGSYSTYRI